MNRIRSLHSWLYSDLSRPVGRFTYFDLCGVAFQAGVLIALWVLS